MKMLSGIRKTRRGALFFLAVMFAASGVFRLADGAGSAIAADSPSNSRLDHAGSEQADAGHSIPHPAAAKPSISEADTTAIADLLKVLKEREAALDLREQTLNERTEKLNMAEKMIEENLTALEAAEASLEATLALADGAMERDISKLTKVYESMKSKDAAILFETMDPNFAAGFLARMKPEAAAGVMAGLTPETAYSVSIILAGRNRDVPVQ